MTIRTSLMPILYEDRAELTRARIAEDNRLIALREVRRSRASQSPSLQDDIRYAAVTGPFRYLAASIQSSNPSSRTGTRLLVDIDRRRTAIAGFVGVSTG